MPTFCFSVEGHTARAVAEHLAQRDVAVWWGNYYALETIRHLGLDEEDGAVRAGIVHYNTTEEVDRLLDGDRRAAVRLLLLGGPKFLGRAVLAEALARGHDVTTFNRSGTDASAWPGVESLAAIATAGSGRSTDAPSTRSSTPPATSRGSSPPVRSCSATPSSTTCSCRASPCTRRSRRPSDEAAPVAVLADPASEDVPADYGALKARCETEVEAAFPGAATHVRAGLIVGPHDPTGRFTYWPHRIASGGDVLVPAPLDRQVQAVDVRDLGAWLVRLRRGAVSWARTTRRAAFSFADVLEAARSITGADVVLEAVDPGFLVEQGVGEWTELPVWVGRAARGLAPLHGRRRDARPRRRGSRPGRSSRPSAATLEHAEPVEGVGLAPDRERELLVAWRARSRD